MNSLPKSLMVLAPHPDDDVIGAGGILSKMSDSGLKSTVIYATGNFNRPNEAKAALSILDENSNLINHVILFPNLDKKLESINMYELIDTLDRLIEFYKPEMILIPNPFSSHQDHRYFAEAAISTLRPSGGTDKHLVKIVAIYEEAADNWGIDAHNISPNFYVELNSSDILKKLAAMKMHKSQDRPSPSERSTDSLHALAQFRGSQISVKYAEAYKLKRMVI